MSKVLIERLREFIKTLRRTPQPFSAVIPWLANAADSIEQLEAENAELKAEASK